MWRLLQHFAFRWRILSYRGRWAEHAYGAFRFRIRLEDATSAGWYDHDWTEPAEIALLRSGRLQTGARVFDLGAHQCVVALMLARIVGPSGSVVAVEASALHTRVAHLNRDANGADNLEIVHAVVGEREGGLGFNEATGSVDSLDSSSRPTRSVTIDGLSRTYGAPDILYLDIEGYECHALRGARQTIQAAKPDCFVEVHTPLLGQWGGSVHQILSHFPAPAYRLFFAPEADLVFQPIGPDTDLPTARFFLVALGVRGG